MPKTGAADLSEHLTLPLSGSLDGYSTPSHLSWASLVAKSGFENYAILKLTLEWVKNVWAETRSVMMHVTNQFPITSLKAF